MVHSVYESSKNLARSFLIDGKMVMQFLPPKDVPLDFQSWMLVIKALVNVIPFNTHVLCSPNYNVLIHPDVLLLLSASAPATQLLLMVPHGYSANVHFPKTQRPTLVSVDNHQNTADLYLRITAHTNHPFNIFATI